jgi:zinc-binding alcohol dehydrogenase/oxidoreductase
VKAWHLTDTSGIDSYRLDEVPEPNPGPGEVRVALRVSGLNHLDLWVSKGLPAPHHFPHVGGADGAGVVDAVGEGAAGYEVGDEVIIDPSMSCGACAPCRNDDIVYCDDFGILGEEHPGTFTEKVVVPTINAVRKPSRVDWDVAGTFGLASVTALRMLEKGRLRDGETVLVVGVGGGVSSAAFLLACAMGATVYVTSRSKEKIDWAVAEGASGGFDSAEEFGKEMAELGGADLVIENVGPATIKQSMRAAKKGGRIAICGATSGAKIELTLPVLWYRQLELIGSTMGSHAQFQRALHYIAQGKAKSQVSRMFGFEDLRDALRYLEAGEQIGNVGLSHG